MFSVVLSLLLFICIIICGGFDESGLQHRQCLLGQLTVASEDAQIHPALRDHMYIYISFAT